LFNTLLVVIGVGGCSNSANQKSVDFRTDIERISSFYDIEIAMNASVFPAMTYYGKIDGRQPKTEVIADCTSLFMQEFNLYPVDLIRRAKLKRVVLCESLSFNGQPRGGLSDLEHDVLYLDLAYEASDKRHFRATIHHEIFHLIDYHHNSNFEIDERWSSLNLPGFKYGKG